VIGETLSHYRIEGELGRGGMGVVYRARDEQLQRTVALKLLPKELSSHGDRRARILAEARAAAALNHPGITTIYEVGEQGENVFIAMELVTGRSLREIIRQEDIKLPEQARLGAHLAEALAAAHAQGIVHGDVKPENIIVQSEGRVKLLDFGIARRVAEQTLTTIASAIRPWDFAESQIVGTVAYMSPEVLRGELPDARADLFSLGVLMYEMAAGCRPFPGPTSAALVTQILHEPAPPLTTIRVDIHPELDRVVHKLLEKKPESRYQSARDVQVDLHNLLRDLESRGSFRSMQGRLMLVVLPFENMSQDVAQEYFSDGLTEEMITHLSRLNPERLGVIARTSAMRYKGTRKSIRDIGRELNVSHALEGSVRREMGRVRIVAQLIQVSDETHLWAETYERDLGDILKLQSEVSKAVAREVRVKLTPRAERHLADVREVSPAAYEFYLKGRHLWNKRTEDGMRKSILQYEEAIRKNPEYAMAYVGIADSYVMLACRGMAPAKETFLKAKVAARKALDLDRDLADAHGSLAHVRLHDWDWEGLEEDFQRAIELNPAEAIVYYWFGEFLMSKGRPDEAIAVTQKAHEIDPLSPVIGASLAMILYLARRYGDAAAIVQQTRELNPEHFLTYLRMGYVRVQQRRYDDAIREMQIAVTRADRSTETLGALAVAFAAAGKMEQAQPLLDELESPSCKRYVLPYNVAKIYAAAGNAEKAFDWLETAYKEGNPDLIELNSEPLFEAIRVEPPFLDLMRRVGWNA
jgi:serine/threonine protein kinase/tetratricopeptide (TPR) repeat protein